MEKIDSIPLTAYIIYNNVAKMFKHRNIKVEEKILSEVDAKKILHTGHKSINISGKYMPGGNCKYSGTIMAAVVLEEYDIISHSNDFVKFANLYKKYDNLIIVVNSVKDLTKSNSIKKTIDKAKATIGNINIEVYDYSVFCCDITENYIVSKHEIMSEDEIEKYKNLYKVSEHYLQKILSTDPQAIWIGLRPGQCVRITGVSQITGEEIIYRYCIK